MVWITRRNRSTYLGRTLLWIQNHLKSEVPTQSERESTSQLMRSRSHFEKSHPLDLHIFIHISLAPISISPLIPLHHCPQQPETNETTTHSDLVSLSFVRDLSLDLTANSNTSPSSSMASTCVTTSKEERRIKQQKHESRSTMAGGSILSGGTPVDAPISLFLVQLCLVVTLCRLLTYAFHPLKIPGVVAEVVAGILLGPSVLGRIPGYIPNLFPPTTTNLACTYPPTHEGAIHGSLQAYGPIEVLYVFAKFGDILFMFLMGVELDIGVLRRNVKSGLAIGVASMALPFAFGSGIAYVIYDHVGDSGATVNFSTFLVFVCVAMSITAFPVLAHILSETGLMGSRIGKLSLTAAVFNDVIAWILLAVVVSIAKAHNAVYAVYTLLVLAGFCGVMLFAVRPLLNALAKSRSLGTSDGVLSLNVVAAFLVSIFLCAWFTQIIGVDVIFGGFIMGLTVPKINHLPERFVKSIEDIAVVLLLPLYFTNSGLKTDIGLLNTGVKWGVVLLVIFGACVGKIAAAVLATKLFAKTSWRESWTVGFLMNTKGLVELIVLNVGYTSGVLNKEVFTIFILMALATTAITGPAVHFIYQKSQAHARYADSFRAVVAVSHNTTVPWCTEVLPLLFGRGNKELKLFVMQEIDDRPSTYMYSEFSGLLDDLQLKKTSKNLDSGKLTIIPKVLSSARLSHDLLLRCEYKAYDLVFVEIQMKVKVHEETSMRVRSDTSRVNLMKTSAIAHHMITHYPRPLAVFIHKTEVQPKCTRVLFVYEGKPFESLALDFIKTLANSGSDMQITYLVKNEVEFDLQMEGESGEKEIGPPSPAEIIRCQDPMNSFSKYENACDLIIIGGDRSSSTTFRSATLQDSLTPLLVLFAPPGEETQERKSFQLSDLDVEMSVYRRPRYVETEREKIRTTTGGRPTGRAFTGGRMGPPRPLPEILLPPSPPPVVEIPLGVSEGVNENESQPVLQADKERARAITGGRPRSRKNSVEAPPVDLP
ncbi:hypothetical protein PROFUN_13868 [Planoprotostelium fungivorum]|uniref:Cation/H+ exchanger transmembrane domain-containing protein n=1 Tax=Planoprotostelium fungivorum TaxID=1890364 RepID=A0A2P6N2S1_9EUKA|nr:hypothetical protein PROFUN_13868 [Planoprotostelium fungivorum]